MYFCPGILITIVKYDSARARSSSVDKVADAAALSAPPAEIRRQVCYRESSLGVAAMKLALGRKSGGRFARLVLVVRVREE